MSETDALEALAALAEVIHIGDLDCEIPEEHGAQAAALLRDRGWQLTRVGDEERLRAALDRDVLAEAMNDFERRERRPNLSIVVETNLGTHRADCIHVGWIADRYEAAPQPPSPASQGEER